jgi:hypothetical protein
MHGLLIGFLLPLPPALFWREHPQPNFFDADAEATSGGTDWVGTNVSAGIGMDDLPCSAFGERVQMGIALAWVVNLLFGCLSFLG